MTDADRLVVVARIPVQAPEQLHQSPLRTPRDELLQRLGDGCFLRLLAAQLECQLEQRRIERDICGHVSRISSLLAAKVTGIARE